MARATRAACLVLNGKAAQREDVRAAVHAVRARGWRVDVRVTWEGGDAQRFARDAADAGVDLVLAGGGDGTVNEVVAGLLEESDLELPRASLGILPLGTANDLASACGIPSDPVSALNLAVDEPATLVDVGRVNGRWFVNMATGGFGAKITAVTPEELKRVLGRVAYLVTGLTRFTDISPAAGRLTGPGLAWEGMFLILAVGNGRQAGGGHSLCPDALLDDGLFDVRVLPRLPPEELPEVFGDLLRGGLSSVRGTQVTARLPWLEVETDEQLQINVDGEPIENTRFRFELYGRELALKLPPDCPLLRHPRNSPGG